MHTDKVLPTYKQKGKGEHHLVKSVEFYPDTPDQSSIDLRRMVLTGDTKNTISGTFNNLKVKDVPYILLSPDVALLVGDTWTAILTFKPELQ